MQVDESKTRLSDPFEHGPFLLELCRELVGCDYKSEAILEVMKRLSANGLSIPLTTDLNMLKEYISSEIE